VATSAGKYPVADLGGGAEGAAAPLLASFRKIHGLPISKIVRTADSTIIIITNFFYLAASSHEIFLRVEEREGMKGLGALQKHQLPHPPCKNPGSATGNASAGNRHRTEHCSVSTLLDSRDPIYKISYDNLTIVLR